MSEKNPKPGPKHRSAVLVLVLAFALLTGLAGAAGVWVLYTEAGLAWVSARVNAAAGEGLTITDLAGTLAAGTRARHIRFAGPDIEVQVTDAQFRVSPLSLLVLTPRLSVLRAAEIIVTTKPTEPRERPPDTLELPLNFQLPDVQVARLALDMGNGVIELNTVQFAYSGGRARHTLHALTFVTFEHSVAVRGSIDARAPFALQGTATATRSVHPEGEASAALSGNLSDIEVKARGRSGKAELGATAHVEPYAPFPVAAIKATVSELDLKLFAPDLPRTAIEGTLDLKRGGVLLAGPVRLTNALHGAYDTDRLPVAGLRMNVTTDIGKTRRFDLAADLGGAGSIEGSGDIEGERARLAISSKTLNLKGLHSRLRETRLAGHADLSLTAERQTVNAAISQNDISLRLVAHHGGNRVDIPEFTARARGGEAVGEARVDLAARQPFFLRAAFRRFDPAAWGDFVAGSINGTITANGAIASREVEAKLAITDSRWLDSPLAARGTFSIATERVRHADVDITLGGNHVTAQGAFGAPNDTLALRVDAPRLAVLDRRLQGLVRGTAEVSGSFRAPGVRFDLTAANLGYGDVARVESARARGFVSVDPRGPANMDASLRGLVTNDARLRTASLRVEGTRDAHSGVVQASGDRIDFRARARGGWKAGAGWTGTVDELVNGGEAAANLVAPVMLSVGPNRVHAEPFELRLIGGRLNVTRLDYERGRLLTAGRFNDFPLGPILAMTGGPAGVAGTLRLSGEWSIRNAPLLTGTIRVTRESGDMAFVADRTLVVGLQTLVLNADFTQRGASFEGRVASALANGSFEGRAMPVGAGDAARYTRRSPIEFSANVSVARLAPFAALIDTTMLLDGEAHAKIRGAGSLGDPQITGPITAQRLSVALPAEGIDLKGGTLRAMLTQREIRVESFSIKGGDGVFHAQGVLARSGFNEASVDWRAEEFAVLGRPDRRLVVSGKGNAGLKAGKLAFTGAIRANEGLFEIGATELPTLGDDVVIAGRDRRAPTEAAEAAPASRPPSLNRASVDMNIDLGSNVQLRGRGLDVWLAGDLKLRSDAQGQLRASGTVEARRGTFAAYGQRLEIERARFYFNGPIGNPGLDIVAMRKRQAVEAGVAVTGTMNRPLVRVVSNPALPEGEALSWLVLGRGPDQAGAGQLSALPLATSAIMGRAGAPIARALNVDEVGLRGGGAGAAQQFLTVGKRITERLYLAFEQSLGGTENLLRLEMTLTERIALRAQTGTASSLGVFYRYAWD
jgi:translocation and assembly module TamB